MGVIEKWLAFRVLNFTNNIYIYIYIYVYIYCLRQYTRSRIGKCLITLHQQLEQPICNWEIKGSCPTRHELFSISENFDPSGTTFRQSKMWVVARAWFAFCTLTITNNMKHILPVHIFMIIYARIHRKTWWSWHSSIVTFVKNINITYSMDK